jgi:urease accessory protein
MIMASVLAMLMSTVQGPIMRTATSISIIMIMQIDQTQPRAALLRLMTWLSPAFPVGAYTYSHGLEWAVESGLINSGDTLSSWLESVLHDGSGRLDADLFCAAWTAVDADDLAAFLTVAETAQAARSTAELALESSAQGAAFLLTVTAVWPEPRLTAWQAALTARQVTATSPVAVALAAAIAGIDLRAALAAFLHAFVANLISAGVRLVPLGQTDGQRAMALLENQIHGAVEAALKRDMCSFGSATPMVDWASMKHENQYTRLFRS